MYVWDKLALENAVKESRSFCEGWVEKKPPVWIYWAGSYLWGVRLWCRVSISVCKLTVSNWLLRLKHLKEWQSPCQTELNQKKSTAYVFAPEITCNKQSSGSLCYVVVRSLWIFIKAKNTSLVPETACGETAAWGRRWWHLQILSWLLSPEDQYQGRVCRSASSKGPVPKETDIQPKPSRRTGFPKLCFFQE